RLKDELKIELGYGFNLLNSKAVKLFESTCNVNGINIPNYLSPEYLQKVIKKLEIPVKSIVILGPEKLDSSGLCPLNSDIAIISRLQCKAPCQKASYAVVDPFTTEMMPMVLDGFCRFHLVNSYIDDKLKEIDNYITGGITDFIIDFSALPATMIHPLLDRYCYAITSPKKYPVIQAEIISFSPETIYQSTT
ncbi:MAG: hypothetical protein AB1782_04260, partial [Cyanobacteriota bacterium]